MSTVSACLVVHDEEAVIERCLQSLDGVVGEIVVVHDGPCQDRTLEIAERYGARTVVVERAGASEPHVPLAFSLATGEWLLRIDADEFLSDELRTAMPNLVARTDVDGWEFTWPIWDARRERYATRGGPYKLALTRRSKTLRSGLPHSHTAVRGRTERAPFVLEHRPLASSYDRGTLFGKWRRYAPIHARVYLMRWQDIPQFGYPADADWPARRVWGNRLSPLLIVPYGILELGAELWAFRRIRPIRWAIRSAAVGAAYIMVVQAHVAKYRYIDRTAGRAPAGVKPARYSAA